MRQFFCLLALLLVGCPEEGHHASVESVEVTVDDIPTEIRIPSLLWDFLDGKKDPNQMLLNAAHGGGEHAGGGGHDAPAAGGHDAPPAGGHDAPAAAGAEAATEPGAGVLFMPVDVTLTEKNPGVLKQSSVRIHLPRGGGSIDLAKYLDDQAGSFFVSFAWPEASDPKEVQSWFVSRARKRRLDNELWGAGCNKFFRITSGLQKALAGGGLKANTTRNRHLTVLGGHFLFATRRDSQTNFLAQVTFTDSRHKNLLCEENLPKN